MIASWMLYALLTGALFTGAALAFDRIARALKFPTRFVWLGAMAATIAWPLVLSMTPRAPVTSVVAHAHTLPYPAVFDNVTRLATVTIGSGWMAGLDAVLVAAWILLAVASLFVVAVDVYRLRQRLAAWERRIVDGHRVCVSPESGPAVVGVRYPEVVLPAWTLDFDPALRSLILRHEAEHLSARDPALLALREVLLALVPWHLPLRYQARRLRLAIELDCDARVLHAHPDRHRYARLLVAIAHRTSVPAVARAVALTEPVSQLERRLTVMNANTPRQVWLHVAGAAAMAIVAFVAACGVQDPTSAAQRPSVENKELATAEEQKNAAFGGKAMRVEGVESNRRATREFNPVLTERERERETVIPTDKDGIRYNFAVDKPALAVPGQPAPDYPATLKTARVEGTVEVQFVVDTLGHADMSTFKEIASPHVLFTASVKTALPKYRYIPAVVMNKRVRVWVQQAFVFKLGGE